MGSGRRHPALAAGLLVAALLPAATAQAAPNNNTSAKLRAAVSVAGITEHNAVLQAIADENGDNRVAGLPGHDASAQYVAEQAEAAGLEVEIQEFEYIYGLGDLTKPVLEVQGANAPVFEPGLFGGFFGEDYGSLYASPDGDVTGPLWAIDLTLPPGVNSASTSGCTADDYDGMPDGAIALVQRGGCNFSVKFQVASASGAAAMIIFNEGNTAPPAPGDDRFGSLYIDGSALTIPGLSASFETGNTLAGGVLDGDTGRDVRVAVNFYEGPLTTSNVIAETPEGDDGNVIVVGAHLDSVPFGPGINDNGSGSSAILEIAEQLRKTKTRNTIRFIWFSAEESGLLGAEHYVSTLDDEAREQIAANLNFDMLGSPNYVRFVYDGDLSDSPPIDEEDFALAARPGSAAIEDIFLDYFAGQGLQTDPTAFDGRSDYGPFIAAGIPAGGLFSGAEVIKTPEQAAIYGGTAGEPYDPCYHRACDTLLNIDDTGLEQLADGAAHATLTLAQNTEVVNGRRGKGNFSPAATDGGAQAPALAKGR